MFFGNMPWLLIPVRQSSHLPSTGYAQPGNLIICPNLRALPQSLPIERVQNCASHGPQQTARNAFVCACACDFTCYSWYPEWYRPPSRTNYRGRLLNTLMRGTRRLSPLSKIRFVMTVRLDKSRSVPVAKCCCDSLWSRGHVLCSHT